MGILGHVVFFVPSRKRHVRCSTWVVFDERVGRIKEEWVRNAGKSKAQEEEKDDGVVAQKVLLEHIQKPLWPSYRSFATVATAVDTKIWQDEHNRETQRNAVVKCWSSSFGVDHVETGKQSCKEQRRKRGYDLRTWWLFHVPSDFVLGAI